MDHRSNGDGENQITSDTGPWAAVPAWIIDAEISPRAFKLYAILSLHADGGASGTGGTTRTRRALAARLGSSVDTLDRAVAELESVGAIARSATRDALGDQGPNRWHVYRARPTSRENAPTGGGMDAAVKRSIPPLDTDPEGLFVSTPPIAAVDPAHPAHFDAFWDTYPRKAAKGDARKAWATARKRAGPAVIIAGAARYRDDPNREPEFTKTPGPWLRAECWDDEPLPARGSQPGPRVSKSHQAIANVFERIENGTARDPRGAGLPDRQLPAGDDRRPGRPLGGDPGPGRPAHRLYDDP